jgi:hypothetical protein
MSRFRNVLSYSYFSLRFWCSVRCDQEIAFVAPNGFPTVRAGKVLPYHFATGYIVIFRKPARRKGIYK